MSPQGVILSTRPITNFNLEIFVTPSLDLIVVIIRKMHKFGNFVEVWVKLP